MKNMKEIPENKCEQIRSMLEGYINGSLTELECSEIDEHLKECQACMKQLDEAENIALLQSSAKSELADVRKIESRFTRKIVRKALVIILLITLGLYTVFSVVLPKVAFNKSNMKKSEEVNYAIKDLIQFGIAGARFKGGNEGETTLFHMISTIQYEQKTVGGGLRTGEVDLVKPLYFGKNKWKTSSVGNKVDGIMGYSFSYPQTRGTSSFDITMGKLEKIGDGTKTRAAIYFEKPVATDEMQRILVKIKGLVSDSWFAIDTGNAIEWQYAVDKPYRELSMFSPQWGFPMNMNSTPTIATVLGDGRSMSYTHECNVTKVSEDFKKEMKAFEVYSEKFFEAPEFTKDLKSLNKYISEHGIKIRGAIVESSTDNILKLKTEENIARIDIVEVGFDY